jgi:hypothetical protein
MPPRALAACLVVLAVAACPRDDAPAPAAPAAEQSSVATTVPAARLVEDLRRCDQPCAKDAIAKFEAAPIGSLKPLDRAVVEGAVRACAKQCRDPAGAR